MDAKSFSVFSPLRVILPLLAIILHLATLPSPSDCHVYDEAGWKEASQFLIKSMDHESYPACVQFYNYSCGQRARSPGDDKEKLRQVIVKELGKGRKGGATNIVDNREPEYRQRLRTFYDQCKELARMNVTELLKSAKDYLVAGVIAEQNANDHQDTGRFKYAPIYYERMFMSANIIAAQVRTVNTGSLNGTMLAIVRSGWLSPIMDEYFLEPIIRTCLLNQRKNGTTPSAATADQLAATYASKVKRFDQELYELNDGPGANTVWTTTAWKLSHLKKRYQEVDWDNLTAGIFGNTEEVQRWRRNDPTVLLDEHYIRLLIQLIGRHGPVVVDYYLSWRMVKQIMDDYTHISDAADVDAACFGILKQFAPSGVARLVFDNLRANITEWRNDVNLVVGNVLSSFRIFISGQDWLDSRSKWAFVTRMDRISIDPGIPEWLDNVAEVNKRTPYFRSDVSPFENSVTAFVSAFRQKFAIVIDPAMALADPAPILETGAQYSPGKIHLNLGQVLPPRYHTHYPLALKYGLLGWLAGYHLMQGFDEYGLREELSRISGWNWVTGAMRNKFDQRKRCLIRQFAASFCPVSTTIKNRRRCLRGAELKHMLDQNVGDIEGLKVAYMAYKFVTQTSGLDPPLPDLVSLTNDQIFFISAAQLHCDQIRRSMAMHRIDALTVVHTLGLNYQGRIDLSMRNFPVFAKTFRCLKGSKYAPFRTCSLWGRFVGAPSEHDEDSEEE